MLRDVESTNEKIKLEIARRIKSIRRSKNVITAQRVADHLQVSRVTYTNIENGTQHVNALTLWKLAVLFDCDITEFFPERPDGYAIISKGEMNKIIKKDEGAADFARALWKQK